LIFPPRASEGLKHEWKCLACCPLAEKRRLIQPR
jgi:hypothetical protein